LHWVDKTRDSVRLLATKAKQLVLLVSLWPTAKVQTAKLLSRRKHTLLCLGFVAVEVECVGLLLLFCLFLRVFAAAVSQS